MRTSPTIVICSVLLFLAGGRAVGAEQEPAAREPVRAGEAPSVRIEAAPLDPAVDRPRQAIAAEPADYSLGLFVTECGDEFEVVFEPLANGTFRLALFDESGTRVEPRLDPRDRKLHLDGARNVTIYEGDDATALAAGAGSIHLRAKHSDRKTRRERKKECKPFGKKRGRH